MTIISQQEAKEILIQELKTYIPFDEADKREQQRFINFLECNTKVYSRENLTGHLSSSSWIVNKAKTKVLLCHHNIYNCRAPLGGHTDDETDLAAVAIQEAQEESGIQNITLLQKDILDITALVVPQHKKKGEIIPQHFHFDIRYLLEADDTETLIASESEVSDVKRFELDEIQDLNIDIMSVVERVMKKVQMLSK